jgi:hypothetical protein
MKMLRGFAAAAVAMAFSGAAQAAIIFNIEEVGANVVMTGSGSLNTSGMNLTASSTASGYLYGSNGVLRVGSGNIGIYNGLTVWSGKDHFGSGTAYAASSNTGSAFGFNGLGLVYLPSGYQSGSALSGTSTFNNKTLASMALNPGSYTFTVPQDTITVNVIAPGAVPEPASWAMMLAGFGLIGAGLRRRKGAASFG